MPKCKVCGCELYGSPVDTCAECKNAPPVYCPTCGEPLTVEQKQRGSKYCSRECYSHSEEARSRGSEMIESNKSNPFWNYKQFVRYPANKVPQCYLYVVSTERGIKVGITAYYFKRLEEVTRSTGDRYLDTYIYRVVAMPTLEAAYLESYIHSSYPHESEYHDVKDLMSILNAVDNPNSWVSLNGFRDEKNPDLLYHSILVFSGSYESLESKFKDETGEVNLSSWTVPSHRSEYLPNYQFDTVEKSTHDDSRWFTLHNGLITHNCRLRLDLRELTRKNGGLFGSGDSTGSIGVVTINLPRIAYEARIHGESDPEQVFFNKLDEILLLSRESLQIKRKYLEDVILPQRLLPAFTEYVGHINNHFSTIGVVGMNEMCMNLLNKSITSEEGRNFALRVSDYIRNKLSDWQEKDGTVLWNYEATPAESTSYRLALIDKKEYPDIYTQGTPDAPYYTNSCHAPVNTKWGVKDLFDHQDDLQVKFTGGTVVHLYCGGPMTGDQAKYLVKTIIGNYSLPYISLSPVVTLCPEHGFIGTNTDVCPICGKTTNKMQRITGYVRDTRFWNPGKKSEFSDRNQFQDFMI